MDVRCSVRPQKPCAALSLAQAGIHRSPNFTDWGTCCLHRGAEEHPGLPSRPGSPGIPRKLSESLKGHSGELEHCASSVGASAPVPAQVLPFFPKGPIAFLPGAKPPGRVRDRINPWKIAWGIDFKSRTTGYQPKPACFQRRFYKLRSPA